MVVFVVELVLGVVLVVKLVLGVVLAVELDLEIVLMAELELQVVLGALLVLGTVLGAVAARRRAPAVAFGLALLGLTYSLTCNLFTLSGTVFAERLLYLPSVAFCLGLVLAVRAAVALPAAWTTASIP